MQPRPGPARPGPPRPAPGLGCGEAGDPPDADGHDTLIFVADIIAAL